MNAGKLQAKQYILYGKVANRIGYTTDLYRPSSVDNPIVLGNRIGSLSASFNAEDMRYGKPNKYGHPAWWLLADGRSLRVGDFLKNEPDGLFFIAAMQTALPILAIACNRTVDLSRPQQQTSVGVGSYGGNTASTETSLMTGWPVSLLQGTKGEQSDVKLPGDTRNPWWQLLMPYVNVTIRSGDIVTDDLDRRYVVSSAELTDLGWRMTLGQVQT